MTNPELNHEVENQLSADYIAKQEFELDQSLKETKQEINSSRRWFIFGSIPFVLGALQVYGGARELGRQRVFKETTICPTSADLEKADAEVSAAIKAARAEGITLEELKTVDLFQEKENATKALFQFCENMQQRDKEAREAIKSSFWPFVASAFLGWGYVSNKIQERSVKVQIAKLEELKSKSTDSISSQTESHSE